MINEISLKERAEWVWRETIKVHLSAPETRLASSLSSVEIFTALYYGNILNFSAKNPLDPDRDRCVISKGHGSICMYPILADLGFFEIEELKKVCKPGSFLGGIPDPVIPGYETLNGSLGHGLGVATGIALGLRTLGINRSVFVVVGDGELQEGSNWEAIMFASHHHLDNLVLIVDDNNISMLDHTIKIINPLDLAEKFNIFGFNVFEVDGHDINALAEKLLEAKLLKSTRPKVVIAKTIKGRGIPGLENMPLAHVLNPNPLLLKKLISDVNE